MSNTTKKQIIDETSVIQKLLYDYPLYNYINEENVNILVLGYSAFTERFIDCAFEMAQVNTYKLHITWASDNLDAKKTYLAKRPAFEQFFCVDNREVKDDYGTLSFMNIDLSGNVEDMVASLLLKEDEAHRFAYILIATEDDDFSAKIAEKCADCKALLDAKFVINCVSDLSDCVNPEVHYISRDDSILCHKDYKDLKRMAFNCHLVWNHSKLLDMRRLQRKFLADYNYISCLSYVISLQYKMESLGIDLRDETAPEKVEALLQSEKPKDRCVVEQMAAKEHARWNVNMICRGFQTADPQKTVKGIETKANNYHPCLVKGTGKQGLLGWNNNDHQKWNDFKEKDLESLDPLDKVSVQLHRAYKEAADRIKKDINVHSDMDAIRKLLEEMPEVSSAFEKYCICLEEIIAGNSTKTALYEHYYSALEKALKAVPKSEAETVKKRVHALAASFQKVVESERYVDYKKYDVDLVAKIPFLLTYRSDLHIGIPIDVYNAGSIVNTAAFRIVESSLIVNPSRITFICDFEKGDLYKLLKVFEYAFKSFDSHHIRAMVNVCLLTDASLKEKDINRIMKVSKRIQSVELIRDEAAFCEYAKKRHLSIFERNRTRTSLILERFDCYQNHFKYNRNTNTFQTNCRAIRYIFFPPFLKVSDIFEFKNSKEEYHLPDMKQEYLFFWNLYKGNGYSEKKWKALCDILGEYDRQKNQQKIKDLDNTVQHKTYIVENACVDAIEKLCRQAGKKINEAICCQKQVYSNSARELTIDAPAALQRIFGELLQEPDKLHDANSITLMTKNKIPYLYYDALNTGVIPAEQFKRIAKNRSLKVGELFDLLNKIAEKGYIRELDCDNPEGISFTYSTHRIKDVMVTAGRVFELYVYYKMLETGFFDDIASSVEVYWDDDDEAENEIDIVGTAGYKVLLIECKAQTVLQKDYYDKLHRINSDYGLNSIPIVVADTQEIEKLKEENGKIMKLGKRVGVQTVYKVHDIETIGTKLKNIAVN